MIQIQEFLKLSKIPLDVKVVREWQHEADSGFVDYVLQHHAELDYQHLRSAMRILQNVNSEAVRDFFMKYVNHTQIGYRTLARGSLQEHHRRGWIANLPAW